MFRYVALSKVEEDGGIKERNEAGIEETEDETKKF